MNKKNLLSIIILSTLFLNITPSFAQDNTNEYKTASTLVRVTTNMFGYNFITRHIAQNVIKKALNKNVKGDYTVKIDSFSGVDLKKGKFRGLIIDGKDLCLEDSIYFSKLHLETTSNFNYVDYSKKPIVFKTDVPMDYVVEITEDDLNKTVEKDNFFNSCLFQSYDFKLTVFAHVWRDELYRACLCLCERESVYQVRFRDSFCTTVCL